MRCQTACVTLMIMLSVVRSKRVDVQTVPGGLKMLEDEGITITGRHSLLFEVTTCSKNVFIILANTARISSARNKHFYTIVLAEAINMITVDCMKCAPATMYPLEALNFCNTTYKFWVAWDPDGPVRVGQGHVIEDKTFLNLEGGNITDIHFGFVSSVQPANWTFVLEDDSVRFLTPSPNGATVVELSESTPIGTIVINITSTRPDLNITAEILGNISSQYFAVNDTVLWTTAMLDYETQRLHLVRLLTSEAVTLSVKIIVGDVNDETPHVECHDVMDLPEEAPAGISVVLPCGLSDADVGDHLQLTVNGPDGDYFSVSNGTNVTMARHLDRDGKGGRQSLSISLVVTDLGGNTRTKNMSVNVTDINDNHPTFSSSVYIVNVTENGTADTAVLNLTVSDLDSGSNGEVSVTIYDRDANDCRFRLEGLVLRLEAWTCDYEKYETRERTYSLTLKAVDNPTTGPAKAGIAVVVIQVQPRNEYFPYWNTSDNIYLSGVTLTSTETSVLTANTATTAATSTGDLNTRNNTTMATSINITTTNSTTNSTVNSTINSTTDTTPASITTGANVTVNIEHNTTNNASITKGVTEANIDRNNNRTTNSLKGPSGLHTYIFPDLMLPETVNIGTRVYTMTASDRDSTHHSNLVYSIHSTQTDKNENISGVFEIDSKTGVIVTTGTLDRDNVNNGSAYYVLQVGCSDGENVIYGILTVNVKEENEYPPVFERTTHSVNSTLSPGQVVDYFNVSDLDLRSNISLYLSHNDSYFHVEWNNATWALYVSKEDNTSQSYPSSVTVIATDQGQPEKVSSCTVVFEKGLCEMPTTTTATPTTTTITTTTTVTTSTATTKVSSSSSGSTRQRVTAAPLQCVTGNDTKTVEEASDAEVKVLTILAAAEGVVMVMLLIPAVLILTGRLGGHKVEGNRYDAKSGHLDTGTGDDTSHPGLDPMDDGFEALSLQDMDKPSGEPEEEMEETELGLEMTEKAQDCDTLKTTDDSGRGSYPSLELTDGVDGEGDEVKEGNGGETEDEL